ncbi:Shikimate kinase I [hydrothermal vent metagenome]|uniref:Shikimate kinase I n=1 Tax=hydrothermal vent metagenome TaxID=652676 RepID=A0A1W1BZM5_9ZZZZ
MNTNIILIGFMGIGKGTTARAFAKEYGIYNIDTDDLIESKENRKVKKIFEESGEAYFRNLEQMTANWIESSVQGTLISSGGGFYKVNNLSKLGKVVLLDASFEWIYNRILTSDNAQKKLKKRPLFKHPKEAKKLYNERSKIYKSIADIVISVEDKSLEKIIKEIAKKTQISVTTL